MKRESSDKTRFCVSHDGLSNVLETFCLSCFMFKNKTKNMFFEPKGLQYNGARAPIYWRPLNIHLPKYLLDRCNRGKSENEIMSDHLTILEIHIFDFQR